MARGDCCTTLQLSCEECDFHKRMGAPRSKPRTALPALSRLAEDGQIVCWQEERCCVVLQTETKCFRIDNRESGGAAPRGRAVRLDYAD
jgi:hypothetical protein